MPAVHGQFESELDQRVSRLENIAQSTVSGTRVSSNFFWHRDRQDRKLIVII